LNPFSETGKDFASFLSNQCDVVLFGAGLAGENALKILKEKGVKILFFCDNDTKKQGTCIDGVKIFPPSHLLEHSEETIFISSDYSGEISEQLQQMGITNFYYFGFCFDYERWHGHFDSHRLKAYEERIDFASKLFSDEDSRNLFASIVKFRKTLGASGASWSSFDEYFHPEVSPKQGDTIIDGGAWTGDTAEAFSRALKGDCQIYSFEPDDENFCKLQENVNAQNINSLIHPVKLGLWSHTDTLKFDSNREDSMQHQVSEIGDIQIQVTSIDEFSSEMNIKIDLIKMDIEGSEIDALLGARETVQRFRPRLQICSYHKFDDLWEIPILIKELFPDYLLYLGHHSQNIFDTIVYARSPQ
jgi:FkbM family methyltransferase